MENKQTDAKTNASIEQKAVARPARDRMLRREAVERKRASTADILGGRRLSRENSTDYTHD